MDDIETVTKLHQNHGKTLKRIEIPLNHWYENYEKKIKRILNIKLNTFAVVRFENEDGAICAIVVEIASALARIRIA